MQSLDIISVNIWHILISLCNLVLIFIIIRFLLFKPVKNLLAQRQAALDEKYARADRAVSEADALKADWEEKMGSVKSEADLILQNASNAAERRSRQIVDEAHAKAEGILHQAEMDAALERSKAEAGIRREIIGVSTVLSEKLLGREINAGDHRAMIDQFLSEIGEDDDRNE